MFGEKVACVHTVVHTSAVLPAPCVWIGVCGGGGGGGRFDFSITFALKTIWECLKAKELLWDY